MDIILWAIIGAFVVWEGYAHFIGKNKEAHTLSNRIWAFEKRHRWARWVVLAEGLLITAHLVFGIPLL